MSRRPLLLVLFLLLTHAAHADDREQARTHYRNATRAYEMAQFDESIKEYLAAYRLMDDPAILYNVGQAQRLARHSREALHFYRMFLMKAPNTPNRAEVEAKIEALQQLVKQEDANAAARPAPVAVAPPVVVAPPSDAPAAVVAPPAAIAPPIAAAPESTRPKKIAVGLLASGLAVAVVGAALTAVAYTGAASLDHPSGSPVFNPDSLARVHAEQGAGLAMIGIGAAATVAGAVLFVVNARRAHGVHASAGGTLRQFATSLTLRF